MERYLQILFGALLCLAVNSFADTAGANSGEADKAWADVQAAVRPAAPADWKDKEPTEADKKAFYGPAYMKAANLAHDFYTKYPQDKRAGQAKFYEMRALNMADRAGVTNAAARLQNVEKKQATDPNASEQDRLQARISELIRNVQSKNEVGSDGFNTELEKGVEQLVKDFPKSREPYQLLIELASLTGPAKAKELLNEVVNSDAAPAQAKEAAKRSLAKMESVGKPVDIKFKAVDGRDVDLSSMKGKVVLVDFWATWCGPCVAEIPHVKEAYEELHSKGFEIVGISLDSDKAKLSNFTADKKMDWPQYFDGKGWGNEIAGRYGINSIPAMWLIDKKGNLNDINARGNLKSKVEKLLAD